MFSLNNKQPFYFFKSKLVLVLMLLFIGVSVSFQTTSITKKEVTIYIQPLGNIDSDCLDYIKKSVIDFYGSKCVIKPKIELSNDLLAGSKTRYEANKIIEKYSSNSNVLLITEKDIAYRKSAQYPEWGIFGLGFRPGKTCVISTFRLKRNVSNQQMLVRLKKVALHEIGHNLGLSHCTHNKECMMNDADGTIKQVDREKIWFCEKCWAFLNR